MDSTQGCDLALFFGDWSQTEKHSEIKTSLGTEYFGNLYLKQLSGVVVYGKYMGDFVQIQLF